VRTVVKHLGHDDGAAQAEQAEPDAARVVASSRIVKLLTAYSPVRNFSTTRTSSQAP
jgi:hypothetical protein